MDIVGLLSDLVVARTVPAIAGCMRIQRRYF
jgi:hypothetical protein